MKTSHSLAIAAAAASLALAPAALGADSLWWQAAGSVRTISTAALDGSSGENFLASTADIGSQTGLAMDAVGGRILWARSSTPMIRTASLATKALGSLSLAPVTVASPNPFGMSYASATGRVYVNEATSGDILWAAADGTGGSGSAGAAGAAGSTP